MKRVASLVCLVSFLIVPHAAAAFLEEAEIREGMAGVSRQSLEGFIGKRAFEVDVAVGEESGHGHGIAGTIQSPTNGPPKGSLARTFSPAIR